MRQLERGALAKMASTAGSTGLGAGIRNRTALPVLFTALSCFHTNPCTVPFGFIFESEIGVIHAVTVIVIVSRVIVAITRSTTSDGTILRQFTSLPLLPTSITGFFANPRTVPLSFVFEGQRLVHAGTILVATFVFVVAIIRKITIWVACTEKPIGDLIPGSRYKGGSLARSHRETVGDVRSLIKDETSHLSRIHIQLSPCLGSRSSYWSNLECNHSLGCEGHRFH